MELIPGLERSQERMLFLGSLEGTVLHDTSVRETQDGEHVCLHRTWTTCR